MHQSNFILCEGTQFYFHCFITFITWTEYVNSYRNKKVLLRERNLFGSTARRVASTPYVVLQLGTPPLHWPWPGAGTWRGGYPPPGYPPPLTWPGGVPDLGYPPAQGTPPARVPLPARVPPQLRVPPSQGTPPARVPLPGPGGTPPHQGTPPRLEYWQGTPPARPMAFWEMLQSIMGYGYPPQIVNRLKTLPSPILRMRAVKSWARTYSCGTISPAFGEIRLNIGLRPGGKSGIHCI